MNYEVLCAVCETGNLTKAAKRLNYSQSAVSQAIQNYEKILGITLFERSKTGVKPLPGVMPIIDSLRAIAEEEKKIERFAESIRELDSGVVRIGCITPLIAMEYLPSIFKEFEEQFPKIRYEMAADTVYDLQRNLRNEEIDFAFVPKMAARDFEFIPIIKDEMVVLLPKGHRLAKQETVDIRDLKDENIMLTSEKLDFEIGDILKVLGLRNSDARYAFNDDRVILKYVELGFGVCILPISYLNVLGTSFALEIKSLNKKYYRTLGMAFPNTEYMTPASTKFVDYVLKWFKQKEGSIEELVL